MAKNNAINNQTSLLDYDTGTANPTHSEGRTFYDDTEKALSYYSDDANLKVNLGQSIVARVYNNSGLTISKGSAVYVSSIEGVENKPSVLLAQSNALSTSDVLGIVAADIDNANFGYVTIQGLIQNIDTSALTAAAPFYLSEATPGALTDTHPAAPNISVILGDCLVVDGSAGAIYVRNAGNSLVSSQSRFLLEDTTQEDQAATILSGASLTTATVASADKVLVQDADDADSLKTVTAQSIADLAGGGGGAAPADATYIVQTANGTLTNEQALDALSDGILKHASGVVSQAIAGTDYYNPGGTDVAIADGGTGASTQSAAIDNLVSGATISSATAATGDKVLIQDADDTDNLKTLTVQSIADIPATEAETQSTIAANSNTTYTLVESTANYFKITFTSSCTLAFTFATGKFQSFVVEFIDAGAYTVTLPTVQWDSGTAPTFTSSGKDIVVFWQNGDNVVYGSLIGQEFS